MLIVLLLFVYWTSFTVIYHCYIVLSALCSPKKQKKLIKIKEPSYHQALDKVFIDKHIITVTFLYSQGWWINTCLYCSGTSFSPSHSDRLFSENYREGSRSNGFSSVGPGLC